MIRYLLITTIFLLSVNLVEAEQKSPPAPTQSDLIVGLVDSLGWSFGLPDKPEIEDYITILNGRKVWRFEFEDIVIPNAQAPLAPKETLTFGPFSENRWQRAPARAIEPELKFLLPLPGEYEIKVALTNPGYTMTLAGKELKADGGQNFAEVSFGTVALSAGQQTATLQIPARGGVDYLLLEAPPARLISPPGGWVPEKELDYYDLAIVLARTLALESTLEPVDDQIEIEAESAPTPPDSTCCLDRYHGPTQGEWIKAGMREANYSHLFEVGQAGIYDLYLNILGRGPISGLLNGRDYFTVTPLGYFTTILAGSFFLDKGTNQIDIDLPSRSGFDRFILKPRASGPDDYLRLAGLKKDSPMTANQLDQILRLVGAIGDRRR